MSAPTIAALLTPVGRGAVATILVRGDAACAIVARYFIRPAGRKAEYGINRIRFGRWQRDAVHAGEELVICRTGEYEIEIHCHGGFAAAEAILADLETAGAARASWQAMITEDDPIAAASLVDLAEARTERTAAILLDQYRGALRSELAAVRTELAQARINNAKQRLQRLLDLWPLGQHLTKPFRVVLAGPPNVGKSTLINALVGYERSIVFDQPGTTRDVVSALTAFDGWFVELSDTAGLRDASDAVEAAGVDRARAQLDTADLVLWVRECTLAGSLDPAQQPPPLAKPPLLVYNKSDLADNGALQIADADLFVSALHGSGLDALERAIVARLVPDSPQAGEAVPFRQEHYQTIIELWQQANSAVS